jgi:hypothetical protein
VARVQAVGMLTARHHLVANHSAGEGVETQNAIDVFRVNRDGLTRALPKREASAVATHIQLLVVALSAARGGLSLGKAPLRAAAGHFYRPVGRCTGRTQHRR